MMDVVSRKCQVDGCLKRPWYSYDGLKSVLCAEHKIPGMIGYRPPQKDLIVGGIVAGGGVGGGGAGCDGMTVEELPQWLSENWSMIKEKLSNGSYQPQPVKAVDIPNPNISR